MKRQLLPLLLCLFITIFALSSDTLAATNLIQKECNTIDYQCNMDLNSDIHFINITDFNTNKLLGSNFVKEDLYQYYSNNSIGGGISNLSVFSYKYILKKDTNSKTNLTPIQYQGNLFNQGLFYGFALAIVLLNLVCFFVFDELLFVKFSATVAALTILFFFTEGLFPLLGINGLYQNQILQSILLLVALGLQSLFADKYLTIKEYYPKLSQVSVTFFGVASLLIITAWINSDTFLSSIANIIMFGILSFYFLVGVIQFSKKNYAKFYVIGTFIPLLFSIDYFVLRPFNIDFLFTEAIHLKVATLSEVLLLSYAIMYRMQAVKEEGELRQTEMRIFLKRQDVMARNKVEQMVEDEYLENLIMQYDLDGFEIKLLQYISEGKENSKIARKLKISEAEVADYTKELYKKLEISEQIQEDYRLVGNQPDYIYN